MMAENGVLTTKQAAAVAALLAHRTVADAAQAAGVGARTLTRWLSDDGFKSAVRVAQDDVLGVAVRRLVAGCALALDTLESVMSDDRVSASVRARAADAWLRHTLEYGKLHDLEVRVAALEAARDAQSGESGT